MDSVAYERLKYSEWRNRIIIDEAKDLFFCYCYIQKIGLGIPNVDRSHYEFLDNKTGFKRTDGAFEKFKANLTAKYPNSECEIEKIRIDFEERYGLHYEILICGKFLISSLHDYLHTIIHRSLQKDDLIWCMVNTFDLSKLNNVKAACLGTI